MGKGHGLRMLTEAVAGEDGVGVLAGQPEEHAAQLVDALEESQHLLALQSVDTYRREIARAAPEVEAAADLLAEGADQVLLAGVESSAHPRAHLLDAVLFHFSERIENGAAMLAREQGFFHEHDGLRFVEGVQRVEHETGAPGGETCELRQHLLAQADAGRTEASIFG